MFQKDNGSGAETGDPSFKTPNILGSGWRSLLMKRIFLSGPWGLRSMLDGGDFNLQAILRPVLIR